MVTLQSRLEWYRKKSNYLGDKIDIEVVNYKKFDNTTNTYLDSSTVIATITVYLSTRGNRAIEKSEKWIIPDSTIDNYLTNPAYYISYTVSGSIRNVIIFGRRWSRFMR